MNFLRLLIKISLRHFLESQCYSVLNFFPLYKYGLNTLGNQLMSTASLYQSVPHFNEILVLSENMGVREYSSFRIQAHQSLASKNWSVLVLHSKKSLIIGKACEEKLSFITQTNTKRNIISVKNTAFRLRPWLFYFLWQSQLP